jgi:hypothetical protein
MVNPVDWFEWIYGRWFVGHPWRGLSTVLIVSCMVLSLIISVLWLRALDQYAEKQPPKQQAVTTNNLPAGIATAPTPTPGTAKAIDKTQPKKQSRKLAPRLTPNEPTTGAVVPQKSTATTGKSAATTDTMVTDNDFYGTTSGFENAGKAERVLLEGNKIQPFPGQSAQIVKNDPGGEMKDIAARNNEIKAAPSSGKPRVGFGGFQIPAITVPTSAPDTVAPNPAPASQPSTPMRQECAPGASCAQSSGQQGGITAGTINIGPPPPPPLKLTMSVSEQSGDEKFKYQKVVTITTNVTLSPVAIGIVCDAPVEYVSMGTHHGGAFSNERTGMEGNAAFVYYEGTPLISHDELYVTLKSSKPFSVLEVRPAKTKGLND